MTVSKVVGVPDFSVDEYAEKRTKYCLLIPVINEGERILSELSRIYESGVHKQADVVILDGGSSDGSLSRDKLVCAGVNSLLVKLGPGRQGAQLRMGFYWALIRGYDGFITVDGNNKDSVESVPLFIEKLDEGYDFVQGSRFIKGGKAVNTPLSRYLAVRLIHAPVISLAARKRFTDTTNGFRAYSKRYLTHPEVQPLRDVFSTYELLAYLSVCASKLGLKTCEVPVTRAYPQKGKTPTKLSPVRGSAQLISILFKAAVGLYDPPEVKDDRSV